MRDRVNFYRQGLAIFVAISLFLLVAFTLEKTGLPRGYIVTLTACSLFAIWAIAVFPGSTTTANKFFFAGKSVRSTINALAMTTCLSFPILLGDSGGLFFSNPSFLIVIIIAVTIGIAFSTLLAARQFHLSHAIDTAHLLTVRFESPLAAQCVGVAILLSGFFLTVCGVSVVFNALGWFFKLDDFAAMLVATGIIGFSTILGGANSNTRLAAIAGIMLLVALNLPLFLNSVSFSSFPLGHLTFGSSALVEMWDLEDQLSSLQIPKLSDVLTPISPLLNWSGGQQVAAGCVVTAAIIFFPSLFQQYRITSSSRDAAISSQKTILCWAATGLSLVALLAFTQFGIYQTILGLSVSEARVASPFLFSWGDRASELVTVCGVTLSSEAELLNACPDGVDHILSIQDITLNSQLVLLGAPDLTALPFAYTAFMTSAILLTGVSFTTMIVLATSNNLLSAFHGAAEGGVASARIFLTRLFAILLILMAAGYVNYYDFDRNTLFFFSMSILASTMVPAMVAALYVRQANSNHVVSAVAVGFTVAILYFVLSKFGIDFIKDTNDELNIILPGMLFAIPAELSAIFAVPISTIVLLIGVFISTNKTAPEERLNNDAE